MTKPNLAPTLIKNVSISKTENKASVSKFQSSGIGGLAGFAKKEDNSDLFDDKEEDLV